MNKPDMRISVAGVELKNPIVTASGTFGFGREYAEYFDLSLLGAVAVKGLTLKPRIGNPPPRIAETPMGMLNSVGLQNPGIEAFIRDEIPFLRRFDTKIIANISGNTEAEYCEMTERVSQADIDLIELNISCPNVKSGGIAFGARADMAAQVVGQVKARSRKPLIVKLTPNVTDIREIVRAAEDAGADGFSLINTLLGMRIDVRTRRPVLANNTGGLSGPAVLPVAVRMIWQARQVTDLPIIGMGGVQSGEDAAELMLAGANAVAVGCASFADPFAAPRILSELEAYLERSGVPSAADLIGGVQIN